MSQHKKTLGVYAYAHNACARDTIHFCEDGSSACFASLMASPTLPGPSQGARVRQCEPLHHEPCSPTDAAILAEVCHPWRRLRGASCWLLACCVSCLDVDMRARVVIALEQASIRRTSASPLMQAFPPSTTRYNCRHRVLACRKPTLHGKPHGFWSLRTSLAPGGAGGRGGGGGGGACFAGIVCIVVECFSSAACASPGRLCGEQDKHRSDAACLFKMWVFRCNTS